MTGLTSLWSDLVESLVPAVAYAEAEEPEKTEQVEEPVEETSSEESTEESEESEDAEEPEEPEAEEDEDDDDDEPEDIMPALEEDARAGPCKEFQHHFDECVARVTAEMEQEDYDQKEYKEDCVEEFFHVKHCIDAHVAPVLFSKLK